MHFFLSPYSETAINLALEEWLFELSQNDFLLIYRNDRSVVMGKHQNAVAEVNIPWVEENGIPYLRRFSGGGTVYHDPGNINFSFIESGKDTRVIDFKKYAMPVIDHLLSLGLNASLSDRNDILLDEFKISGHAAHAKNKRALHHGTLLFNADLEDLSASLRSNKDKFVSRAVKSVRSKVCNLSPSIPDISIEMFIDGLLGHLKEVFSCDESFQIDAEQLKEIEQLAEDKYKTWEWNFAYGPEYEFGIDQFSNSKLKVEKGIFSEIIMHDQDSTGEFIRELLSSRHHYTEIKEKLEGFDQKQTESILQMLF